MNEEKKTKLSDYVPNPDNPRLIGDEAGAGMYMGKKCARAERHEQGRAAKEAAHG